MLNGRLSRDALISQKDLFESQSKLFRNEGLKRDAIVSALKVVPIGLYPRVPKWRFPFLTELHQSYISEHISFKGHWAKITDLEFSLNRQRLLSGSNDETARLWDARTGALIRELKNQGIVGSVAISSDGNTIVTGTNGISLWNAETGEGQNVETPNAWITEEVAFGPDDQWFAAASANSVGIWSAKSGELIKILKDENEVPIGTGRLINHFTISPNGKTIVTSHFRQDIKLWNVASGKIRHTIPDSHGLWNDLSFSPDGKKLLTVSSASAKLWNFETRTPEHEFGDGIGMVAAKFHPDGENLIYAGKSEIRIVDLATDKTKKSIKISEGTISDIAVSPDGKSLIVGFTDGHVRSFSAMTEQPIRTYQHFEHGGGVHLVALSDDGRLTASAGRNEMVKVWDNTTQEAIYSLRGHTEHVEHMVFSNTSKYLAVESSDGSIYFWDLETGHLTGSNNFSAETPINISFSPDDQFAFLHPKNSQEETVRTLATGKTKMRPAADNHQKCSFEKVEPLLNEINKRWWRRGLSGLSLSMVDSAGNGLAVSPGCELLAITDLGNPVSLYNLQTGEKYQALQEDSGLEHALWFSPSTSLIASRSFYKEISIWDVSTGKFLSLLKAHDHRLNDIDFAEGLGLVATASEDGTARLWDMGPFGIALIEAANLLLSYSDRAEVERERIRYWEVDPAALQ